MRDTRTVALALLPFLSAMAVSSCTTCSCLPVAVVDDRPDGSKAAVVDVYAVSTPQERERARTTPVDEYFRTLGLPGRPDKVWRAALPAAERPVLLESDAAYRAWKQGGAVALVALTPAPARSMADRADPRRLVFSLCAADHPSGTRSLAIHLTDGGLSLVPSSEKLKHKPKH